jgi:hypothetical protein
MTKGTTGEERMNRWGLPETVLNRTVVVRTAAALRFMLFGTQHGQNRGVRTIRGLAGQNRGLAPGLTTSHLDVHNRPAVVLLIVSPVLSHHEMHTDGSSRGTGESLLLQGFPFLFLQGKQQHRREFCRPPFTHDTTPTHTRR